MILEQVKREVQRPIELHELVKKVRAGALLACGVEVARLSRDIGARCAIVTSTYHHDMAFEAIRETVGAPYVDTVDPKSRHKEWTKGIELLNKA